MMIKELKLGNYGFENEGFAKRNIYIDGNL